MLPICTQRLTEFESVVRDIFDFFDRFGFFNRNYNSKVVRWILLNFQRMITNLLHIYYKCSAEFEIVV